MPLIETAETKRLGLGAMTRARWQTLVEQLVSLKLIDHPVDVDAALRCDPVLARTGLTQARRAVSQLGLSSASRTRRARSSGR